MDPLNKIRDLRLTAKADRQKDELTASSGRRRLEESAKRGGETAAAAAGRKAEANKGPPTALGTAVDCRLNPENLSLLDGLKEWNCIFYLV